MALRVPLVQALLHDWTKFLPPEHAPYVEFFYVYETTQQARIGPIRHVPGFHERIVLARDHHQVKNPHHWQYWLIDAYTNGNNNMYALPMPERFVREMVADWTGAGRAQGCPDTVAWYHKNKHEIVVHPDTQRSIERLLDEAVRKGITWSDEKNMEYHSMNIVVDERPGNVAVVGFAGRLDFLVTTDIKQRLYQIVDSGFSRLVIDLGNVTFIDSSGLTTLISGLKSARLAGGDLRVANPGDEARTILELTRLDQVMQIFLSVDDAVNSF